MHIAARFRNDGAFTSHFITLESFLETYWGFGGSCHFVADLLCHTLHGFRSVDSNPLLSDSTHLKDCFKVRVFFQHDERKRKTRA